MGQRIVIAEDVIFYFAVQGPLKISARSVSLQAYPKFSWTMETTVLSEGLRGHAGKWSSRTKTTHDTQINSKSDQNP